MHRIARCGWLLRCLGTTAAVATFGAPAVAQEHGALERFQPVPAGDPFFGVPAAQIGGHLTPRAAVIVDYANQPLSIAEGDQRFAIVSHQLFLHANFSFALFDRLQLSADMPFALYQDGDDPTVAGVTFESPHGAEVGDLRLGARARIYGEYSDPFQLAVGGYIFAPTAGSDTYAGEGAVRGLPQLLISGRAPYFVYSLSAGTMLTASERPHGFDLGVGAAAVLADDFLQLGPELTLRAPFERDVLADTSTATISVSSLVSAELLLGAKLRPIDWLVLGAGAGPGLTQGWGTPVALAVGSIGYEPKPEPGVGDRDEDGIDDPVDACPEVPGVASDDPERHGCPAPEPEAPADRDGDGIVDDEDACPDTPGVASSDPAKNGCPREPSDGDADGIVDDDDACPEVPGVGSSDPARNGCPPDRDGDGIVDEVDACPDEPGPRNGDPAKNGCPRVVVTDDRIEIDSRVEFRFGHSEMDQTVDPVSDDLLLEVRDTIERHPEIELIEVQGHTDSTGPEDYNRQLSLARANAVRDWLIERGIPSDKLTAKGYGSSQPRATNVHERGRRKNRRVEFFIKRRRGQP